MTVRNRRQRLLRLRPGQSLQDIDLSDREQHPPFKHEWILLAAAGLSVVAAIVGVVGEAPAWFWGPVVAVLLVAIVGPRVATPVQAWWISRQQWSEVNQLVPEFHDFVRKFEEWSSPNRATLHLELSQVINNKRNWGHEAYRMPQPITLNFLATAATPFLLDFPKDLHSFSKGVRLFESLLDLLKREYVEEPLRFLAAQLAESPYRTDHGIADVKK